MVAVPLLPTTCIHWCSDLGVQWFSLPSCGREILEKLKQDSLTPLTGAGRGNQKRKEWKELVNRYPMEKEQKRHWRKILPAHVQKTSLSHLLLNNMATLSLPLCFCPPYFRPASFLGSTTSFKFPYGEKKEISISRSPISQPQASKPHLMVYITKTDGKQSRRAWIRYHSASTTLPGTAEKCVKAYLNTTLKYYHSLSLFLPNRLVCCWADRSGKGEKNWQALFHPSTPAPENKLVSLCLKSRSTQDLKTGSTRVVSY